jgi:hypothetical protein
MRINRDNIDEYYDKVNSKIDHYFGKGIDPASLKTYFKKGGYGITRFKEREELTDVEGIDRVIIDCVEDRIAMNEDLVIKTFESFHNEEGTYNLVYELDNQQHVEKVLSDHYKVSMGHIHTDGTNKIEIKSSVGNGDIDIFVFETIEDLDDLFFKLTDQFKEKVLNLKVEFLGKEYIVGDYDQLSDLQNNFHTDVLMENFNYFVEYALEKSTGFKYKFVDDKNNDIYIFEKVS